MLSVDRENGAYPVGSGIHWNDRYDLEGRRMGVDMEESIVLGEQPYIPLAVRLDIGHVFDRMVVYCIIIGETFLDVVSADYSVAAT